MTKYVAVTTISSFRHRYMIPVEDLQKFNPTVPIAGKECEWAEDCVTCEDAEEFSQVWVGETIIDSQLLSEQEMLQLFDKDNDYLSEWTIEKKIQHVNNWRSRTK